jgi:hypothetical protein
MATSPRTVLPLVAVVVVLMSGCADDRQAETPVSPEEQVLLAQLTRDNFVEILIKERNDLDQLVVTTRQGSERVRYVFKPSNPGEMTLSIHRINDRSTVEVSESGQLGTGPETAPNGRYR